MKPEEISELLGGLGIYPKPMPKTLGKLVKVLERSRHHWIARENEAVADLVDGWHIKRGGYSVLAAAIRARVNP